MNEPIIEEEIQHPHAMSRVQLELALERLEYEQGVRDGDVPERFGWERERERYDRRGSYVELALALDRLAEQWPAGYLHIRRLYLRGLSFELSPTTQLLTDAGEEWLAREMRGEIRVPRWLLEQAATYRQETVYELAANGMGAGAIARRLRLPKLKVQRMLRSFTLSAEVLTGASGKART